MDKQVIIKNVGTGEPWLEIREINYLDELSHVRIIQRIPFDSNEDGYAVSFEMMPELFDLYRKFEFILIDQEGKRSLVKSDEEDTSFDLPLLNGALVLRFETELGGLEHYAKKGTLVTSVQPGKGVPLNIVNGLISLPTPFSLTAARLINKESKSTFTPYENLPKDISVAEVINQFQSDKFTAERNYIGLMAKLGDVLLPVNIETKFQTVIGTRKVTLTEVDNQAMLAVSVSKSLWGDLVASAISEKGFDLTIEDTQATAAYLQVDGRSVFQNNLGDQLYSLPLNGNVVTIPFDVLARLNKKSYRILIGGAINDEKYIAPLLIRDGKILTGTRAAGWRFVARGKRVYMERLPIINKDNPVKLAVLGTCYSRRGLATSEYFSPDYKELFNVVHTQFHTSMVSIMSEPVVNGSELISNLNLNPTHRRYIEADFNKTYFEDLAAADPDFLVFDLYADSHVGMLDWGDNALSMAFYFYKIQLKNTLDKTDVKFVNHDDVRTVMARFETSARQFFEHLFEIIPASHVILQKSYRTYSYWDAQHKEVDIDLFYNQAKSEGLRGDFFAELMSDWIEQNYPDINVIDLESYNLRGQFNHPDGPTTNHYEPAWYKAYIGELAKTVLQVKLAEA